MEVDRFMEVDGLLDQLYGDFFQLVPSAKCHRPNTTADDKKEASEKKNFRVQLDVSHFNPNEINVRIVGRDLIVDGKHEERQDEHGFISRSFTRKYELPEDVDQDKVVCQLSKDGKLLKLEAPKKEAIEDTPQERMIAIQTETETESAEKTVGSDTKNDEDGSLMAD